MIAIEARKDTRLTAQTDRPPAGVWREYTTATVLLLKTDGLTVFLFRYCQLISLTLIFDFADSLSLSTSPAC